MKLSSLFLSVAFALSGLALNAGISADLGSATIAIGTTPYTVTVPLTLTVDGGSSLTKFILNIEYDTTRMTFDAAASAKVGTYATVDAAILSEPVAGKISYRYFTFTNPVALSATEVTANLVFNVLHNEPATVPVAFAGGSSLNSVVLSNEDGDAENDYTDGQVDIVKLFNAADATLAVNEDATDTAVDLSAKFTDGEDNAIDPADVTITGVTQPANGTVEFEADKVTYRPNANFNGDDTFTYTAENAEGSDSGTVTVTVAAVNDIPILNTTGIPDNGWQEYAEQAGLAAVFSDVDVIDPDVNDATPQANYTGATFYAVIENIQANDELTYPVAVRTNPGGITLTDLIVSYGGIAIGTMTRNATGFSILLDGGDTRTDVTPAMIEDLITDLRFQNDSDAPSEAERIIRVSLDDAPGAKTTSDHLFEVQLNYGGEGATNAYLDLELWTDAAVRSITVDADATSIAADQYGNLTGTNALAGLQTAESFYEFILPEPTRADRDGVAEWEFELGFDSWDNLLAAFPAAVDGLSITLTYWDGNTSTLVLDTSGVPATAPATPDFQVVAADGGITVTWDADAGAAAATNLEVLLDAPAIYDLTDEQEEFEVERGVAEDWPATEAVFAALPDGRYEVEVFAGTNLIQATQAGVAVEVSWDAGTMVSNASTTVGDTFAIDGTITAPVRRAEGDELRVSIHAVDAGGDWQWYMDLDDVPYQGANTWTYSATVADLADTGFTHYIVVAYTDTNNNQSADTTETVGQTGAIDSAEDDADIALAPPTRSWTNGWRLIADAYLYISLVNDAPVNDEAPSITGTAEYGQTLTADTGTWTDPDYPDGSQIDYTYQWYYIDVDNHDEPVAIRGETGATLYLNVTLVDKPIAVEITATDQGLGALPEPNRTSNQTVVMSAATDPVARVALGIKADDGQQKTYGDADPAFAYTPDTTLVAGDSFSGALDRVAGEDAGTYAIGLGTLSAGDGYDITYAGADFTIVPLAVTVTPDADQGKVYDTADPVLAYTHSGLIGEDAFAGALARAAGEDAGTYAITLGDLTAGDNYTIDFTDGILFTITPAPADIFFADTTQTYDGTGKQVTVTTDPVELAHTVTYDGGAALPVNAGTYAVVATITDPNYTGTEETTLTIEKAAAEVVIDDPAPVYDGNPHEPTVTTNPPGLTVDLTYNGDATAPTAAGDYAVVGTINDANYQGGGEGNLTIAKKPLTITADDKTRSYWESNDTVTFGSDLADGIVPTDAAGFTLLLGTNANDMDPWNGLYQTTVAVDVANSPAAVNYDIETVNGTFTITSGNAPVANGENNDTDKRLVVVTGRQTPFSLLQFFEDEDVNLGFDDALLFRDIANVTGPAGITVEFPGRDEGDVVFDPGDVTQGAGDPIPISFDVRVLDSANPNVPLTGTVNGLTTIYLTLIDNEAPELDWTGTSASPVAEGNPIEVSVAASDVGHTPQADDLTEITVAVTTTPEGLAPAVTPTVTLDGKTGTLTCTIPTDENTSTFLLDTVFDIEISATDAAGAVVTENRQITVTNVNLSPNLPDIADQNVDEDDEGTAHVVRIDGVNNGGEDNDPRIVPLTLDTPVTAATINATVDRPDIVDSIALAEVDPNPGVRGNGDDQSFELTYTLAPDANGEAVVTVTVNDASGYDPGRGTEAGITKQFTITVNPVNDAPVNDPENPPTITGEGHVGYMLIANFGIWNDQKDFDWIDGEEPEGWITSSYQWEVLEPDGRSTWTPIEGAIQNTFVPTIEQNGHQVRVVVTATDSGTPEPGLATSVATEPKTIDNAPPTFADEGPVERWGYEDNEAPEAGERSVATYGYDFTLTANDEDGDTLAWSIITAPANGTATVDSEGNVVYRPGLNDYNTGDIPGDGGTRDGPDIFVVQVDDGLGGTADITVEVTVVAVNDAPVVDSVQLDAKDNGDNDVSLGQPEDIAKLVATVAVSDTDDGTFAYHYTWQVERDGATTDIDTADTPELTTVDLDNAGLAAVFVREDKITVNVEVTDQGGGQEHSLPAELTANGTRTVSLGSPSWYPQVVVPGLPAREIVSFVQVRIENTEGETVLTAILARDDDELILRPEDYMTADGIGADGLLPGMHTPYFAYWNTETGEFGEEIAGTAFTVAYDEPERPTGIRPNRDIDPQVTVQAGGAAFSFRLAIAQGYILEIRDEEGALVKRLVRALARPNEDAPFPVTLDVVSLFLALAPGTYTWDVIAYNPLAPVTDPEETLPRDDGNEVFTVEAEAPVGIPAAPTLVSPGENVLFNPSPTTAKAVLDFHWSAVPGAAQYYLYVGLVEGVAVVNNELTADTAVFDVPLGPGVYRWAVRARNEDGKSAWSEVRTFVVNTGPGPGIVTGEFTDEDAGGAPIDPMIVFDSFGLPPASVDLYILDRGTYRSWLLSDLAFEDYVLTGDLALPGHTYWFKTRSVTDNGTRGAWSAWDAYRIDPDQDEVTVTAADIDTATAGKVTFTWDWNNAPDGAQVVVRIMRLADYSFFEVTDPTGDTTLEMVDPDVTGAGEYYYQLRPVDADGQPLNDWTPWDSYTIPELPAGR